MVFENEIAHTEPPLDRAIDQGVVLSDIPLFNTLLRIRRVDTVMLATRSIISKYRSLSRVYSNTNALTARLESPENAKIGKYVFPVIDFLSRWGSEVLDVANQTRVAPLEVVLAMYLPSGLKQRWVILLLLPIVQEYL